MAETGFWAFLKRLFGMQCEEQPAQPEGQRAQPEVQRAQPKPQQVQAENLPERYCLTCHKVTQGTLSPKPEAQAMTFTCKVCAKQTQVLS